MNIKAVVVGVILLLFLGVALFFAALAVGLLISYGLDKLFSRLGRHKEKQMDRVRKIKPAHDVMPYGDGTKALLVLTNEPHSREYKRLMKREAKMWNEYFSDLLIACGDPNQEEALKAFEKKYGVKL